MSSYLVLDSSGRGTRLQETEGDVLIDSHPELARITEQPKNYIVEEGGLVYSPAYMPSEYHKLMDGVWVYDDLYALQIKNEKWEKIKLIRDTKKLQGFLFKNALDNNAEYWIHSDEASRIQHLGLVLAAVLALLNVTPFPTNQNWKTLSKLPDGSPKELLLNPQVVLLMFGSEMKFEGEMFAIAKAHKANLDASRDPLNYDISTGWLTTFEDL